MKGTKYYDVKGGVITNVGGVRIKGKSDDGVPIELPTQVGDKVRKKTEKSNSTSLES